MERCLYCYQSLSASEKDYHRTCARKFFGLEKVPDLPYSRHDLMRLAEHIVKSQKTVTGVQPKLSLEIEKTAKQAVPKFAIAGLWGDYILKPPNDQYPCMPETESLTMCLAETYGIDTVPFSLIRLSSGELAYITRRIDRNKQGKIAMEDMCQLTERLTEDKYKGSYEQIGKVIRKFSVNPGLDALNFFEVVLFSWLTGNADMHLKNFSLINTTGNGFTLSPAYDLIASKLLLPQDPEEMALTLNGKKNKIKKNDFLALAEGLKLDSKATERVFLRLTKAGPHWKKRIAESFLPEQLKEKYIGLVKTKIIGLTSKRA